MAGRWNRVRNNSLAITIGLLASVLLIAPGQQVRADPAGAAGGEPRRAAAAITAGQSHACAIISGGDVTCWGADGSGQLGNGLTSTGPAIATPPAPISMPGGRSAKAVSAGTNHTCAILDDASLTCWGGDDEGQLGNGAAAGLVDRPPAPIALPGGRGAIGVATSVFHTCAVLDDASVTCWGFDVAGALGNGAPAGDVVDAPPVPVTLPGGRGAVAVTVGIAHTCVLLDDGGITCWGSDGDGRLGNGAVTGQITSPPQPITLPGGVGAVAVTAGEAHTCAVLEDGAVTCWGRDVEGQLGNGPDGSTSSPPTPIALPGGRAAVAVAAGTAHTCALLDDGSVTCWGSDTFGELGNGPGESPQISPPAPIVLPGGRTAIAITSGERFSCALLDDDSMTCWGRNSGGNLGNGSNSGDAEAPTPTLPFRPAGRVLASALISNCAVLNDATVSCWGSAADGRLGNGATAPPVATPPTSGVAMPGGRTAISVSAERRHACALSNDGTVACWGDGTDGRLGNGASTRSLVPVLTAPLPAAAVDITVGDDHSCALLSNRRIACWGSDEDGRLGNGAAIANSDTPSLVTSTYGARTPLGIAAGARHTCAVMDDGTVWCWGDNEWGQLSDGTSTDRATPVMVAGIEVNEDAVDITSGAFHSCALLGDGGARCWGRGSDGQLGNDDPTDQQFAQLVDPFPSPSGRAYALAAGGASTCALLDAGQVTCWGDDTTGQLGNGATSGDVGSPPAPISLPRPAVAIDIGVGHACALLDDGTITCWGSDGSERLGNGAGEAPTDVPGTPAALRSPVTGSIPSATVPGRVASVVASTSIDGDVVVGWTAAPHDGGSPIERYRIQRSSNGGASWSTLLDTGGPTTAATLRNQTLGTTFVYRVAAINAVGAGAFGPASNAITPRTLPSAPRSVRATAGNARASVSWSAPSSTGGGPVTGYTATAAPGGRRCTTASLTCTITGLTNGTRYTITVRASTSVGVGPASTGAVVTPIAPPPAEPAAIVTRTPARLYESRRGPNETTIDRRQEGTGRRGAGTITRVNVAGRAGIPNDAAAAILNAAAIGPDSSGFITIYDCTPTPPQASTLNYAAGQVIANGATVKLDARGDVCIFTSAALDLIVDVTGFLPAGSPISPITPARLFESRRGPNETTVDRRQEGTGRRGAGTITRVNVAGRAGIPNDATTATVNVAAIGPDSGGFITIYDCTPTPPQASTLNYAAGQVIANGATVKLDARGDVCIFTSAALDLIVDVTAHLSSATTISTITPARLYESRRGPNDTTIDGRQEGTGPRGAGTITRIDVAGRATVPPNATAAILNVAAIGPGTGGFLTIYDCTPSPPQASTLNYAAGQVIANGATVKLDARGDVCIFTFAALDLIVDVTGFTT